jgi:hypothetical protein
MSEYPRHRVPVVPTTRPARVVPPYSINRIDISVIALFRDRCIGYPKFVVPAVRHEALPT